MRVLVLQVERIKAKKESGQEVQHPQETEDLRQALGDMTEDGVGVGEGCGHRDPHSSSSPSIWRFLGYEGKQINMQVSELAQKDLIYPTRVNPSTNIGT
ncbi:hypothetical protein SAY86_028400 [Trapa natans]|uniref:Uncharacterized protein n=1 Tax=Trapa natans TaxID=22666 RepID=A0AAN7M0K9_TRANT|nr:hypothetical protein SAY86_028400 [Trapa natans]